MIEYILELRGAQLLQNGSSAISIAWGLKFATTRATSGAAAEAAAGEESAEEEGEEAVVVVEGVVAQLVPVLMHDPVLTNAVDQLIPFSHLSDSWEEAISLATRQLPDACTVRLVGYPAKSVIPQVLREMQAALLSPASFTHVLSCMEWNEMDRVGTHLLWSMLPRTCYDPRAWREAIKAPPCEGLEAIPRKKMNDARAIVHHLTECEARYSPGLRVGGQTVMAVSDRKEKLTAIESWCRTSAARSIDSYLAAKSRDEEDPATCWTLQQTNDTADVCGSVSVALVYMSVDYKDSLRICEMLRERLQQGGVVVMKLQINPDYSRKPASDYAKRPNNTKLMAMARCVVKLPTTLTNLDKSMVGQARD